MLAQALPKLTETPLAVELMIHRGGGFLRWLGGCGAAGLAVQWPLTGVSRPAIFEPSRFKQDDGLIRLNIDELHSPVVDLDSELLLQVVASFVSLCKLGTCWVSAC